MNWTAKVLLALSLFSIQNLALGRIIGSDDRLAILSDTDPYQSVLQLIRGTTDCSAFVISRNLALTARHCVVDAHNQISKGFFVSPNFVDDGIRLREGLPEQGKPNAYIKAEVLDHDAQSDWALLRLEKNLGGFAIHQLRSSANRFQCSQA